ncbi:MAG: hypothetical protein ACD_87C00160G0003 [uncultured bacterium]|nr:MAG: hypothetical protein ACD_87C00160G0003 [uncultured bacterium]
MDEWIHAGCGDIRVFRQIVIGLEKGVGIPLLPGALLKVMNQRMDRRSFDFRIFHQIITGVEKRTRASPFPGAVDQVMGERFHSGRSDVREFQDVVFLIKQAGSFDYQIGPHKIDQPEDPKTKGPEQAAKNLPDHMQPSPHGFLLTPSPHRETIP